MISSKQQAKLCSSEQILTNEYGNLTICNKCEHVNHFDPRIPSKS